MKQDRKMLNFKRTLETSYIMILNLLQTGKHYGTQYLYQVSGDSVYRQRLTPQSPYGKWEYIAPKCLLERFEEKMRKG